MRHARVEDEGRARLRVDLPAIPASPEDAWLYGLDADLERALAELPETHRQAVELRVVGGLSYAQVAARLGCSPLAARIRVSRSLARLRTRLEGGLA